MYYGYILFECQIAKLRYEKIMSRLKGKTKADYGLVTLAGDS